VKPVSACLGNKPPAIISLAENPPIAFVDSPTPLSEVIGYLAIEGDDDPE
jgi:hypothetical protein